MAMEPPVSMNSDDVRDEKVKVLRATEPIGLEDIIVGQYTTSEDGSKQVRDSYTLVALPLSCRYRCRPM